MTNIINPFSLYNYQLFSLNNKEKEVIGYLKELEKRGIFSITSNDIEHIILNQNTRRKILGILVNKKLLKKIDNKRPSQYVSVENYNKVINQKIKFGNISAHDIHIEIPIEKVYQTEIYKNTKKNIENDCIVLPEKRFDKHILFKILLYPHKIIAIIACTNNPIDIQNNNNRFNFIINEIFEYLNKVTNLQVSIDRCRITMVHVNRDSINDYYKKINWEKDDPMRIYKRKRKLRIEIQVTKLNCNVSDFQSLIIYDPLNYCDKIYDLI